jgi:hypothetical protein
VITIKTLLDQLDLHQDTLLVTARQVDHLRDLLHAIDQPDLPLQPASSPADPAAAPRAEYDRAQAALGLDLLDRALLDASLTTEDRVRLMGTATALRDVLSIPREE